MVASWNAMTDGENISSQILPNSKLNRVLSVRQSPLYRPLQNVENKEITNLSRHLEGK